MRRCRRARGAIPKDILAEWRQVARELEDTPAAQAILEVSIDRLRDEHRIALADRGREADGLRHR